MIHQLRTDTADQGQRLDLFIHSRVPELSRTHIRRVIDLGGVHINGKRTRKCGLILTKEQQVDVHLDQGPNTPYRITREDVLYQDDYIIALNKPVGVETQPTLARYKGTLYEALQIWLNRDTRFGRKLEIGMVQRLDRNTSGVIVFSIHPRAHKGVSRQIQERTAGKRYLALVPGCPEPMKGTLHSMLARDRRTKRMISVDSGGKEAITHYRVLHAADTASLILATLVTGRTHQIRAHLAEAGFPLLGDTLYGGKRTLQGRSFSRQCLHSWQLDLVHPLNNKPLKLTAPLPEDMLIDTIPQRVSL